MGFTIQEQEQINNFLTYVGYMNEQNEIFIKWGKESYDKLNAKQKEYVKCNHEKEMQKMKNWAKYYDNKKKKSEFIFISNPPSDIELVAYPTDDYQTAFIFYSRTTKSFYIYRLTPYGTGDWYKSQERIRNGIKAKVINPYFEIQYNGIIYDKEDDSIFVDQSSSSVNRRFERNNISDHLEIMNEEFYLRMGGDYSKTKLFLENLKNKL